MTLTGSSCSGSWAIAGSCWQQATLKGWLSFIERVPTGLAGLVNEKQQSCVFFFPSVALKVLWGEKKKRVWRNTWGKKMLLGTALSWKWEKFSQVSFQYSWHRFIKLRLWSHFILEACTIGKECTRYAGFVRIWASVSVLISKLRQSCGFAHTCLKNWSQRLCVILVGTFWEGCKFIGGTEFLSFWAWEESGSESSTETLSLFTKSSTCESVPFT